MGAGEQPVQVLQVEELNVEESAIEGPVVEVLLVEQSTEEVLAVEVSLLEESLLTWPNLSTRVLRCRLLWIGLTGESVYFTVDVHVTDAEISSTDDDGENMQPDEGDIEATVVAATVVGLDQQQSGDGDGDGDTDPYSTTEVRTVEVRSTVEEGSGSSTEEEVVVVSIGDTGGKLTSTVTVQRKRSPRTRRVAQFQGSRM
ncbi:hypothetical protein Cgig2_030223 [Carnegiea gigantea]|uniref:Uncharacterized protein n=1 Tax=Carnegiea gigantea TaxID=171969 RepID=A0A9Q1GQJ3_9CARY|nr:hypothetical protein Cgig2_030223 [Carnegiea gigantea]